MTLLGIDVIVLGSIPCQTTGVVARLDHMRTAARISDNESLIGTSVTGVTDDLVGSSVSIQANTIVDWDIDAFCGSVETHLLVVTSMAWVHMSTSLGVCVLESTK